MSTPDGALFTDPFHNEFGTCSMQNRSLLNRRALDWLDDVLAAR
ncbi:hypothetical protein ACFVSU_10490 [Microbacterium sp. NPDC058062]